MRHNLLALSDASAKRLGLRLQGADLTRQTQFVFLQLRQRGFLLGNAVTQGGQLHAHLLHLLRHLRMGGQTLLKFP